MTEEKPAYCPVQLVAPCASWPQGKIEEGFYRVEGGYVVLTDRGGKARTNRKGAVIKALIARGESPRKVAARLVKANMPKRDGGFNRRLHYFNPGKI